jgi:hypothetical protein
MRTMCWVVLKQSLVVLCSTDLKVSYKFTGFPRFCCEKKVMVTSQPSPDTKYVDPFKIALFMK